MGKTKRRDAPMIQVGASKATVREAREMIMDILYSGAESKTQRAALAAATTICQVNNSSISNCHLEG